jgi:hypothetical protein
VRYHPISDIAERFRWALDHHASRTGLGNLSLHRCRIRVPRRSLAAGKFSRPQAPTHMDPITANRHRLPSRMHSAKATDLRNSSTRTQTRVDLVMLATVLIVYLLVRIAWAPTNGFARYHLTDLLAGVALPSLVALLFRDWEPWESWSRSLPGKLAMTFGAAMIWEGLVPLLSQRSTADLVDGLCYLIGALCQHGVSVLLCAARTAE